MKLTVYERLLDSIVSARTYEISPTDAFILKSPHIRVSCQKQRGAPVRIRAARSRQRTPISLSLSLFVPPPVDLLSSILSSIPRVRESNREKPASPFILLRRRLSPPATANRVIYSHTPPFLHPFTLFFVHPSRRLSFRLPTNFPPPLRSRSCLPSIRATFTSLSTNR